MTGSGILLFGGDLLFLKKGVEDPGGRGDQNDTHGHDAGGDDQQGALLNKSFHISLDCLLGSIVNVGTGDQGDQGGDQIGDGWIFPDPGHDLGVGGGNQGADKTAHGIAAAVVVCKTENGPGDKAADGTEPAAASVDIPDEEEADTGHEYGQTGDQIPVDEGCRCGGDAPEGFRSIPGGGGTQSNGRGDQQGGDDPVDTGVGISEDDVPQGVGKQQPWHQQHQGADDGGVDVPGKTGFRQRIGKQGHEKTGGQLLEKGIGVDLAEETVYQSQKQTAKSGTDAVGSIAAIKYAEAAGHENTAKKNIGEGISLFGLIGFCQPLQGNLGIRPFGTDPAAQVAVFFHSVQVGAGIFHPAQLGDGQLAGNHDGDEQAVGHRVHPGIQPVSCQDPDDAFFDPVGFRTGHSQPGAKPGNQFH